MMFTFKDIVNLLAGEIFQSNGFSPDAFAQSIQFAICMIGSNPFI